MLRALEISEANAIPCISKSSGISRKQKTSQTLSGSARHLSIGINAPAPKAGTLIPIDKRRVEKGSDWYRLEDRDTLIEQSP